MNIKKYTKEFIKNNSIKTSYIAYIVLSTLIMCIFLVTVVCSVWYFAFRDDYTENYISSVNTIYENKIYTTLNHLNNFTLNLSTNQNLYLSILDRDTDEAEKQKQVREELEGFLQNTTTIVGVEIKTMADKYTYFKENVKISECDNDIFGKLDKRKLYIDKNCMVDGDKRYFRIGKKLSNFYSGYMVGDIILYVEEEVLNTLYSGDVTGEDSVFITVDNIIISHTDKFRIGNEVKTFDDVLVNSEVSKKDEKQFLINTYSIDKSFLQNEVKMVCVVSRERVMRSLRSLITKVYVLVFLFMIFSLLLAIKLSQSLTRDLIELTGRMEDFKTNMFKDKIFKKRKGKVNEIERLEDSFEKMLGEIKLLIAANEENSEKRRIAELNALQAQINPHFLYNVLDVISWLAKMEEQELIDKMVTALSKFYRMGLHNGENEIPVRDEIEHIKNYAFLQKVRFPDLFFLDLDIEEEILDARIIKIVLQPLVENAIKHGFCKVTKGGVVKITGRVLSDSYIEFTVSDNGCGLSADPLGDENQSMGYGVRNVNERLIMAYGKECGLRYSASESGGTQVSFKIKSQER